MTPPAAQQVDVLLCTFRRPGVVETLRSLEAQSLPSSTALRVIIADNDETPTAADDIARTAAAMRVPVLYRHAPARNISIARNICLETAEADWVAFIDDDETAAPDWLAQLLRRAEETGADAVFGPALAEYGAGAPDWMRRQDHHSNVPVRRGGCVETGHTCNALLRWRGAHWQDERFDLARGKSGGEDTEFFFRLRRMGARFEIATDAVVREPVTEARLTMRWLMRRKYRMGQSYAAQAHAPSARLRLAVLAVGKSAVCAGAAVGCLSSGDRRNFWLLRGAMHMGVVAGCLSLDQPHIYGES